MNSRRRKTARRCVLGGIIQARLYDRPIHKEKKLQRLSDRLPRSEEGKRKTGFSFRGSQGLIKVS